MADTNTPLGQIKTLAEYAERIQADTEIRYSTACEAGRKLAQAVWGHLEKPTHHTKEALQEAYTNYVSLEAGNFWPPEAKSRHPYTPSPNPSEPDCEVCGLMPEFHGRDSSE